MRPWKIILDQKASAAENMRRDEELFKSQTPAVRIYGWTQDSITLGYFQDPQKELDIQLAKRLGVDWAKRPTGGGIAFHSPGDVAYCVSAPLGMLPRGLINSYLYISSIILKSLLDLKIRAQIVADGINAAALKKMPARMCFARSMSHEISVNGKKVVGSAQRRTKDRMIQQGTISMHKYEDRLVSVLRGSNDVGPFENGIDGVLPDYEQISNALLRNFKNELAAV